MPNKIDLSTLYPNPKTADELARNNAASQAARIPQLVPLKVGAWSTMAVGVLYFAININMGIVAAAFSSSPGEVMVAVSGSILTGLLGFAVALYLTALIRSLLAKAIVNATPLEFLLMGVAIASGVLCIFLLETGSAVLPTALLVLPLNAALSYLAAARLTR